MQSYKSHKIVHAAKIIGMAGYDEKWQVTKPDGFVTVIVETKDESGANEVFDIPIKALARYIPGEGDYLVQYRDGYMAISPGKEFEDGYAPAPNEDYMGEMTFSTALGWLKKGRRATRRGWNGKDMWIAIQFPGGHSKMTEPYIYLTYPTALHEGHYFMVPWTVSQKDVMVDDWELLSE